MILLRLISVYLLLKDLSFVLLDLEEEDRSAEVLLQVEAHIEVMILLTIVGEV